MGSGIVPGPAVPANILTTKGDLIGFSTDLVRIPVGTNGQFLSANSAQASGVQWVAGGGGADANAIYRNGSQPPTANQPWGGFGITGISSLANGNTNQLTVNSDGSLTHNGASGQQAYTFSRRTGALDRMTLQGQTTGIGSGLEMFSKDGNGTSGSYFRTWGVGTPASVTNSEHLFMGWDQSVNQYIIATNKAGTGTQRQLLIQAGIANQLLLNTDGSITNRNIKTTPNNANGVDFLQTISGSSFFNFFGTPGTAANAVILGVYGLGTSGASANLEGARLDYNGSSKYELHTIFAGTGIARPLEMFTRNSGGSDNVGQIRLNTDGSVDFGGTLGTNPYKWLVNSSGVLNLQRTNAGQAGARA